MPVGGAGERKARISISQVSGMKFHVSTPRQGKSKVNLREDKRHSLPFLYGRLHEPSTKQRKIINDTISTDRVVKKDK